MTETGRCLNCSAPLHGSFCAACGQRAVPPNPTVRELAGDAWHEMTGYDGRIMATIRGLARPGFLTREYTEGRRAHYLPPVRLYLIASVIYFVIAASAPQTEEERRTGDIGPGGLRIEVPQTNGSAELSPEDRAKLLAETDDALWIIRPMLRAALEDPAGFRQRVFTVMPRVFFGLLPVFAAVVALFYRRRPFPTSLVFAVHLHAFAFLIFALSEVMKFSGNDPLIDSVDSILAVVFAIYALKSFRSVFGGRWPITVVKAAGIGFLYLVAAVPAFIIIILWASWI